MAGFEFWKAQIARAGAKVVAVSVDPIDKAKAVAAGVSYPVGFGATREMADAIGAWWEGKRNFMQPAEFLINAQGEVMGSSYSAGPLGRIEPMDVVRLIDFYEALPKK